MNKVTGLSAVEQVRANRGSDDKHLRNIALLSSIGLADFIPISLYQLGVIRHLPDPPGSVFNSDKVNRSEEAQIAGIPDGVVSLLMYGATMVITGATLARVLPKGISRWLLGGLLFGQAAGGAYYLTNMVTVQKKICPYCVTGALINFASLVPLTRFLKSKI